MVQALKESHPGVKVLYVSGHPDDTLSRHSVLDPNVNFLQKPFSPDRLADKVHAVLHGEVLAGNRAA